MKCRICGCTQLNACPGGCDWAERMKKRSSLKEALHFLLATLFIFFPLILAFTVLWWGTHR